MTATLRRLATVTAVAVTVTALLATTAAAETTTVNENGNPSPVIEPSPQPPAESETIEDLPIVDDPAGQRPPKHLFKQLPAEPTNAQRTVGRGTDGHYCSESWYIRHVSYTFNSTGGYTTIHVEPRTWFRLSGGAFAHLAWNTLVYCMRTGGPHGVYVRSWAAIEDQFLCHALGHALAGTSWDLEGHRHPTNNVGTWIDTRCNW